MISSGAALALNHLLQQQQSARERLAPHAGQRIEVRSPPLPPARLDVLETGLVAASRSDEPADLTVSLDPLALPLLLARSADALAHVQTSGETALDTVVRGLLLELRWDFEEDLSRLVGDVAAHRAGEAARDAWRWQRDAAERLARNFSEYWTEERPLLARRIDFASFAKDLKAFEDDLQRLEARLAGR